MEFDKVDDKLVKVEVIVATAREQVGELEREIITLK